ncbi:MAG TPA: hypothetical protein VME01_04730 [Solirubrobacteraceae bacterium]|nr:hypothetical protein [Solirubrobacteraceae bacterium]
MNTVRRIVQFIWAFVVGDDWRIAVGVGLALALTLVLADDGVSAWWLLPTVVALLLSGSVWSVARSARR